MKMSKKIGFVSLLIFAFLALSSCAKKDINFKWSDITTAKYRYDDNVNYIIAVKYKERYDATVVLYSKEDNIWTEELRCEGLVGKNGIGKTKEGDMLAPLGDFSIGKAFGIKSDPGTSLEYVDIDENIYGCGDENFYNQIINIQENPHECDGEHMIEYSPEYNYGFEIRYNDENVFGKGGSIFFHCMGAKAYTGGCVAVSEENMGKILTTIDNTTRVIINYTD